MSAVAPSGPFCGAHGCRDPAVAVVEHPDHGELVACAEHARDFGVVRDV